MLPTTETASPPSPEPGRFHADEFDPMNLASWGMDDELFSSMSVGGVFISKKQMSPERARDYSSLPPCRRIEAGAPEMADETDFASKDIDDQFGIDSYEFEIVNDESDPIIWVTDVGGASNSEKQITQERLQKHLQEHPNTRKKHAKKEKELRDIVLRAAECGYSNVMRRALPMLDEVRRRLKQKPESRSVLNFCEGKGGGSPPWNKQVSVST